MKLSKNKKTAHTAEKGTVWLYTENTGLRPLTLSREKSLMVSSKYHQALFSVSKAGNRTFAICRPSGYVVIRLKVLRREYRRATTCQLNLCKGDLAHRPIAEALLMFALIYILAK